MVSVYREDLMTFTGNYPTQNGTNLGRKISRVEKNFVSKLFREKEK